MDVSKNAIFNDDPVSPDSVHEVRDFTNVESAISVRNVCIDYRSLQRSSIKQNFLSLHTPKPDVFRAVNNVSFEVPEGQILGITGKNGSGKSTMLRAIAGIFSADSGEIDLHGHSISLLSIGVGFKNDLSGRENIILSGMLLGFSREHILEKMDDIIEFSGIEDFIDKPVRTYSSGMHSKLAFSITAVLETEIMLIDEVLSVGDQKFKKKSYNKMKELISKKDRTVVIVSHSMSTLWDLCDQIIWLHDGEIVMYDTPDVVLPVYEDFMR
ncbi:MAG: ABC transporter ATP-binding protein [Eubacterium sp.]|nr:ABC transporter ATP-binding protein [Eubacterium sp.]